MEYKAIPTVAGAIEGRVVTGYAAVMGNVDTGNVRVINGAFKKTIKEQNGRIKHLWVHNLAEPHHCYYTRIGRSEKRRIAG